MEAPNFQFVELMDVNSGNGINKIQYLSIFKDTTSKSLDTNFRSS
jgi:hypothetical protein